MFAAASSLTTTATTTTISSSRGGKGKEVVQNPTKVNLVSKLMHHRQSRSSMRRRSDVVVRAEAQKTIDMNESRAYYFCIANADFMLNDENNEHFPEILRERRRFYRETEKLQDFWIVPNPTFLDSMPEIKKKIRQPCVAVMTTDEVWNTFIKLRMDRVYKGSVEGTGAELLKSNELIAADAFPPVDPSKWTAPYNKYSPGWWEVFYPGADWTQGYQATVNPLAEEGVERTGA
ncbi:unnamed protein product [Bathycoccus prasinos]